MATKGSGCAYFLFLFSFYLLTHLHIIGIIVSTPFNNPAVQYIPPLPNLLAGGRGWDGCDRGWIWSRHWYGKVLQHQVPLLRPGPQCGRPGGHHPGPQDARGRAHCHCWGPFAS